MYYYYYMSNNLIIQLLNTIYSDNNRQIQLLNTQIDNLRNQIIVYNETNDDIHNILTTLNQPRRTRNSSNVNISNTYRGNRNTHRNENSSPLFYGNIPYISENQPGSQSVLNSLANFLEPILIFPTAIQIEIATRTTRFCNIISPMNTSCPISLETFNENDEVTIIRYCGHIFTTVNIQNWFRSNCKCPVCRYDIRNYVQSNPFPSPANTSASNASTTNTSTTNASTTSTTNASNASISAIPSTTSTTSTTYNIIEPNSHTSELDTLTRNFVNSLSSPMINELLNSSVNSFDVSNNTYDTDSRTFYFTYETRR